MARAFHWFRNTPPCPLSEAPICGNKASARKPARNHPNFQMQRLQSARFQTPLRARRVVFGAALRLSYPASRHVQKARMPARVAVDVAVRVDRDFGLGGI